MTTNVTIVSAHVVTAHVAGEGVDTTTTVPANAPTMLYFYGTQTMTLSEVPHDGQLVGTNVIGDPSPHADGHVTVTSAPEGDDGEVFVGR